MYFFANFKMYCSYEQTVNLTRDYCTLAQELPGIDICLLPSMELLCSTLHVAQKQLAVGAQTCSGHSSGAYAGQVSPFVLQQLGCQYCLVGHSEVRKAYGETDQIVVKKTCLLIKAGIRPIICIGEREHMSAANAASFVKTQLEPVIFALQKAESDCQGIIIAYEPPWAIGGHKSAPIDHICAVSDTIHTQMTKQFKCGLTIVYGGSVNEQNIQLISSVEAIDGVLVGRASTDFQTARKMLQLLG